MSKNSGLHYRTSKQDMIEMKTKLIEENDKKVSI